jgi:predicted glycoside hydrolase/deacetylase ChbG (UPF0249 family)
MAKKDQSHNLLKFVADDYGESASTSRKIEEVARHGLVRNITAVASSQADGSSFHLSEAGRKITWGAHLFLTGFPPLSARMQRLMTGRPMTKRDMLGRLATGSLRRADLEAEFQLQLELLERRGFRIEFLDTHQNIHWVPQIFKAVEKVAASRGLVGRIRPTMQLDFSLRPGIRAWFSLLTGWVTQKERSSRVLVGCPGYQRETTDLENVRSQWTAFLAKLRRRRYSEIVVPVHPGLSAAEMIIYQDPALIEILADWI